MTSTRTSLTPPALDTVKELLRGPDPGRTRLELKLTLVTPMFGGGVVAGGTFEPPGQGQGFVGCAVELPAGDGGPETPGGVRLAAGGHRLEALGEAGPAF